MDTDYYGGDFRRCSGRREASRSRGLLWGLYGHAWLNLNLFTPPSPSTKNLLPVVDPSSRPYTPWIPQNWRSCRRRPRRTGSVIFLLFLSRNSAPADVTYPRRAPPGGKGTVRRKIVRKTKPSTAQDDKKLQGALKKLNVQPIPGVEEVNMFREDGNVLHFTAPKGASCVCSPRVLARRKALLRPSASREPVCVRCLCTHISC